MRPDALTYRMIACVSAVGLFIFISDAKGAMGPTFNLDHEVHIDLPSEPNYIEDPVPAGLTNAVPLLKQVQSRCNYTDKAVCLNLTTNNPGTFFGSPGDSNLDVESYAQALTVANLDLNFPIKIVRSLFWDNSFKGGAADSGFFEAVIAFDFGSPVYAHEFGHMCALDDRYDCIDAVMYHADSGAHDQLNASEASTIAGQEDACCVRTGTAPCDPTGVAAVEELSAVPGPGGVELKFFTAWEVYTASFEVRRVDPLSGQTIYTVGSPSSQPGGYRKCYSIVDPNGIAGSVYHLIEHQDGGRGDLLTGPVIAEVPPPAGAWESHYDADSLAAVVATYSGPEPDVPDLFPPCSGTQPRYLILCPDSFATALFPYASLWQNRGVSTRIRQFSQMDTCSGGVQAYIRFAAAHGTTHFLLVGDANDHVMWDDSTRWVNGWQYPRVWGNGVYLEHYPSQPEKDILPTFYPTVADSPQVAWTYWTPYFATDVPYADTDADGLPDVIVGRLPASSVADITAYTAKLATWLTHVNGNLTQTAGLFTYAVNHGLVPAWPTAFAADSLRELITPSQTFTEAGYIRFGPPGGTATSDSIKAIANAAASGGSDVIVWNLNSSDRYEYSGFWRVASDSPNLPINSNSRPFISLALSCGMNNFDMTEDYGVLLNFPGPPIEFLNPRRPIVERLLFDPGKGAIAQIGPTRASYIEGNPLFGLEFLHFLYQPGNTVGRAFLLAQRNAMLRYPEYADLFRSYVLLGDPRLGPGTVTGVSSSPQVEQTRLLSPEPNPFNPVTRFRYYLAGRLRSSLTIFDVHGRVVRRLLQEAVRPAGWGEARWDGRTDQGRPVASGMYFARMDAGKTSHVKRVVLLK